MTVKQISVFIENNQGSLAPFCRMLADKGIDLIALSLADTTNFGILRIMVSDPEAAYVEVLAAGYTANLTDVLAVAVPDHPGGLAEVLDALSGAGIGVEYLYSLVHRVGENAVLIVRVEDPAATIKALASTQARILSQEEVR